jgi:hypothetical protein
MRKALLSGLLLAIVAACTSNEINSTQSPRSAAESFLFLIDRGNFQESWADASPWLKDNVDAAQWAKHAGSYRQPLGTVDHREFKSVEFHDSLEDMPAGKYAFVFFDSSLADNSSASEMVGLSLDVDSIWRVIGYQTL